MKDVNTALFERLCSLGYDGILFLKDFWDVNNAARSRKESLVNLVAVINYLTSGYNILGDFLQFIYNVT
jgi:hypothetical protein